MPTFDEAAEFLKALAHPVRLRIAQILRQDEACVCHLEAYLGLRQAYISQQLMVLRKAGLLAERREGTYVFYRIAYGRVGRLLDLLDLRAAQGQRAGAGLPACSCPHCQPVVEAPVG